MSTQRASSTAWSKDTVETNGIVFQCDNAVALRHLRREYSGRIRCIYLDPPYNNGERYAHYCDNVAHERWLADIKVRLGLLLPLLRDDGSIWISIDDNEAHYLKVLADSVLGRERFVTTVVWNHRRSRENRRAFSTNHEYILVYAKHSTRFRQTRGLLDASESLRIRYSNPDDDPRGPWQSISAHAQAGHGTRAQFYEVVAPNGRRHSPPNGRCWTHTRKKMEELMADGRVWFGRSGNGVPRIKRFLAESRLEITPPTLWLSEFAGTTEQAKKHLVSLFPDRVLFDTPKPELLMRRVLEVATDAGDWVLDPYLGSGTTAATAHKLGRHYVGIERSAEAAQYAVTRLERVIEGEQGGVSADVEWRGGGAFSFEVVPDSAANAA